MLVRAFDKAVRRMPLAFAADAVGLWELHVGRSGERVPVVERVEQSGGSPVSRGGCIDDDEGCEVTSGSGARHKSAWRDGAREVFEMGRAAELGIDLTLAGHSHGGQLALSFINRGVALVYPETPYVSGRYEKRGSQLYVNRGIGTTGPPIRLGARPEITVLELSQT